MPQIDWMILIGRLDKQSKIVIFKFLSPNIAKGGHIHWSQRNHPSKVHIILIIIYLVIQKKSILYFVFYRLTIKSTLFTPPWFVLTTRTIGWNLIGWVSGSSFKLLSRQTIGLLVHNDYAPILIEKLRTIDINPIDFDPFDQKNVNDPKYKDAPTLEKQQLAKELQNKRAHRSIQFIRSPIKFAVTRAFHNYGWITLDDLKQYSQQRNHIVMTRSLQQPTTASTRTTMMICLIS